MSTWWKIARQKPETFLWHSKLIITYSVISQVLSSIINRRVEFYYIFWTEWIQMECNLNLALRGLVSYINIYIPKTFNSYFHGNIFSKAAMLIVPQVITVETDRSCSVNANVAETSWSSHCARHFKKSLSYIFCSSHKMLNIHPQSFPLKIQTA